LEDYTAPSTAPATVTTIPGSVLLVTTQDEIGKRFEPEVGANRVELPQNPWNIDHLPVPVSKTSIPEREDLAALTIEAAAMARLPLAGTHWTPGW